MDKHTEQLRQQEAQNPTTHVGHEQAQQQDNKEANDPANRMQDGTNDFKNGDQEPKSESSGD